MIARQLRRSEIDAGQLAIDVLANIDQGVVVYNRDLVCLARNRFMDDFTGIPSDRVLGRTLLEIAPGLKAHGIEALLQRVLEGDAVTLPQPVARRRGSHEVLPPGAVTDADDIVWQEVSYQPHRDQQGSIVGVITLVRDVTERQSMLRALSESEARFRAMFEQAAVGIAQVSVEGRWIRANQRLCEIVDYSHEELTRLRFQDITHPDDLDLDLKHVGQLLAGEIERYSMDKRYLRKDGTPVWIALTGTLVRDAAGAPDYFIAVVEDIQRRKDAEAAALEERRRLEAIADHLPAILFLKDLEGRYVLVNPATAAAIGRPREQILGHTDAELFPPEAARQYRDNDLAVLASRTQLVAEEGLVVNGESRVYLSHKFPLLDAGGRATHLCSVSLDITERKRAEAALIESETRYRALLESLVDGVFVAQDKRFVFANPALPAMLGYSMSEFVGLPFRDVVAPEYLELWERRFEKRVGTGPEPPPQYEVRILCRDRTASLMMELRASRLNYAGRPAVLGIIRDISARKAAEAEIRRWADAFENCAHGIAMGDPATNRLLHCNPAFARMMGARAEDLAGFPIAELHRPENRSHVRAGLARADATGSARYESRLLRRDGSELDVQVDVVSVREEGRILYRVATIQDIGERLRADAEIRKLNAELELRVEQRTAELRGANAELESFAYAVSHDLRAPLRAMRGFSQALKEDFGDALAPEARAYLDQIDIGGRHMGDLIDGLLQLSRSTRGELRRDPVDLSAIATRILEECARTEPSRDVRWQVAPGLAAPGDGRMVEAVLRNLIDNAWKYTAGRHPAEIVVDAVDEAGVPMFRVADNGAGFDPAHATKLFQPFQRLHRQDEFPGIGIGLATAQRIIHRHGGRILARGTPGRGAAFLFTLTPDGTTAP